jgi:hypothetical protein
MIDLRKRLQAGDTIELRALENGLQIVTVLPPGQAGCRVTEVACDYLVAEDESNGIRLRLPVHCVASFGQPTASPEPAQAA